MQRADILQQPSWKTEFWCSSILIEEQFQKLTNIAAYSIYYCYRFTSDAGSLMRGKTYRFNFTTLFFEQKNNATTCNYDTSKLHEFHIKNISVL